MHVLLIEDDELVASGILAGLRLSSITADHADTASTANAALATSQFDVAILDLGLPDEDGMAWPCCSAGAAPAGTCRS